MLAESSKTNQPEPSQHSLKILVVSDIHNSFQNIQNLINLHKQSEPKYDYVFALGDFDVIRPEPGETTNDQNNNYTDLKRILTDLEAFSAPNNLHPWKP